MADLDAPWHAHIYFTDGERPAAAALHRSFAEQRPPRGPILFVGTMANGPIGPHPIPQFEIHFAEAALDTVRSAIEDAGLTGLIHPLTRDDRADHTAHAQWIGAPLELDLSVLDPPGHNQGIARFGESDL